MPLACDRVIAAVSADDQRQIDSDRLDKIAAARQQRSERMQLTRAARVNREHQLASHDQPVEDIGWRPNNKHTIATEASLEDTDSPDRIVELLKTKPTATSIGNRLPPSREIEEPGRLPLEVEQARPLLASNDPPRSSRAAMPQAPLPNLDEYGTVDLVGLLYDDNGMLVAKAEAELARRGFTGMHLELAKRLTDPDPEVRRRWVQSLPGMQDLDARPWLLWLARDEDTEVRRTALSLLATGSDPETLATVERLARDDADPRIQVIATKITERRAGRKRQ